MALVRRRLHQGAFRLIVADIYEHRCAVTGERTLPVLEAAHIMPVSRGGQHRPDNGLLLRSDIHTLFDLGYVTVTKKAEFKVSSSLTSEWQNGKVYYALQSAKIRLPSDTENRPSGEFLEWHNDTVFRG
jgi:putative restriction endonuclease